MGEATRLRGHARTKDHERSRPQARTGLEVSGLVVMLVALCISVVTAHSQGTPPGSSADTTATSPDTWTSDGGGWWRVSSLGTTWHDHHAPHEILDDPLDDLTPRRHTRKVRHHHDRRLKRRHLENQHEPRFTHSEYQQTVKEDILPGTSILQVHAIDDDQDEHGLIRYSVSDPEHFRVDEGGVLYNIKPLDYEHTDGEYLLHITAEDQGLTRAGRKKAMAPVRIRIENTPDAPWFDSTSYQFSVSEFAKTDSYVGTVVARDEDGDFDSYSLSGVQPPGLFVVSPTTGIIKVGNDGVFNDTWEFVFQAVASDKAGQSQSVTVTVNIIAAWPTFARLVWTQDEDENTNKPVFPDCNSYSGVEISENMTAGTPVLVVVATDQDHGVNGEVTYSILNDFESFAISTVQGQGHIVTTKSLDRDTTDKEFYMTVVAKDNAPHDALQEPCSFRVVVTDVNDNPPIFDQAAYSQRITTDHIVDTPVLRVTATDMDVGDNARVSYTLEGPNSDLSYFSVDNDTGFISLAKPLTVAMADTKTFSLTAVAEDRGTTPLSSQASVTIEVVASGKQPPTLESQTPLNPSVPEDAADQTDVVTVCAKSNIEGDDRVDFTLLNGNTPDTNELGTFDIRKLEAGNEACGPGTIAGVIYVAIADLDYESTTSYKLILEVVNAMYSRADFQIQVAVTDVNDNPPLLQPFDGAVVENADPGHITTLQAVDKDASEEFRQLTFSFNNADQDVTEKFQLQQNGDLSTRKKLDREEKATYRIPIAVTDGISQHRRTRTYYIMVSDVNDEQPVFDASSVLEVALEESTEVGRNTGISLVVVDPDIVNHNEFQIVEGNDQGKFRIDSTTGDVLVHSPLDYDPPNNDRNFTIKVRLSDGLNPPAETHIVLAVTNVNDQQPEFMQDTYTFNVTENQDCNIDIGPVTARDPDLPSNVDQNIGYFLSPMEETNFTIGETNGILTIKGCLDREAATRGQMTVYPRAMDEGGTGLDANPATVYVNIKDINDNHPYIQSPDFSYAMVMENAEPGSPGQSVTIQLSDLDSFEEGHGCPCTLVLDPNADPDIVDKFTLSAVGTGISQYQLAPRVVLDREEQKIYRVPLRTTDVGGVTGVRILTVEVGDENDSPMTDGQSSISVYNYQGQFPDVMIGSVYVTDEDDHDVKDKDFRVDSATPSEASTYFTVNPNTGNITMNQGTPAGDYTLRVEVIDNFRGETAMGTVGIRVVDLTEEAVMQSGSFRVANVTAHQLLARQPDGSESLYEQLKARMAAFHGIDKANVDIFTLRDVAEGVDVRYNCHGSPYFTAARLNGLLLANREKVMGDLGINIPLVDINWCLYEELSPCKEASCQHSLRPNMTWPLVVAAETATMVGVDIADDYTCDCGALEPPHSVCHEGYCYNGGICKVNQTLICECPDNVNYGPRCELLNARFEGGFAWYEPPKVCDNSTLKMSFETTDPTGVLLYAGPTVTRPWPDYPKDFLYVILNNWVLQTFLELGSGIATLDIELEHNTDRSFDYIVSWGSNGITFEVPNCLGNGSSTPEACKKTLPLQGTNPSVLLNTPGPLQVGGMAAMPSLQQLAVSYGWSTAPPSVRYFFGCVLELRYNDYLYDLNATDYAKATYQPCNAPVPPAQVILGQESIIIIVVSLLILLLVVLLILCLARRGRKTISNPELDGIVKETIGGTDLEGYGEKDMTHYDLKLLRVGPDGNLFNDHLASEEVDMV